MWKNNSEENSPETYAYIKTISKIFWQEKRIFLSPAEASNNLMITTKDLNEQRKNWTIIDYDDICYKFWGEKGCLNLLDENQILKPIKENSYIHKDIEKLLSNVCWDSKENYDYLNKAILYKYCNINDFTIPALVLFWAWGSWKGTLITLLATIFGEDNVLSNLGQRELNSSFDVFKGDKIVLEFAEITTNNTQWDKRVLNKLKNLIGAEYIMVNEKNVKAYKTNSICWFIISSNSQKPIQLDDKSVGNRRFTVIKSYNKLTNGEEINKTVRDKEIVSNYLWWLHNTYPEVLKYKKLEALDNQDKKDLEERSQEDANKFWDWIYEEHPDFRWKKTKHEVHEMITVFCLENDINEKEFLKFFWHNSRHPLKRLRFWKKLPYWVELS